jgi:hypothetical protein
MASTSIGKQSVLINRLRTQQLRELYLEWLREDMTHKITTLNFLHALRDQLDGTDAKAVDSRY